MVDGELLKSRDLLITLFFLFMYEFEIVLTWINRLHNRNCVEPGIGFYLPA